MNGTHQRLAYADDVNLLGDNIDTIKKNTETLIAANKVGIEINVGKTKKILLSRHQNAGQNHEIKIANRSFENVTQFKYLGMKVTIQNLIQEKITKLNSSNACCHSVHNLLSSRMLSKNAKIGMYENTILPAVLYVCETWSLTLKEEYRLVHKEFVLARQIVNSAYYEGCP
jgi:hypothetical protein